MTLSVPHRKIVCHQCRETPAGCWRVAAPRDPRGRILAGAEAAAHGRCPLNKWGHQPPPSRPAEPTLFQPESGSIDVVYFLGPGSERHDWELRYSLRSIHRNFLDLARVYVVGHRPRWLVDVEHLDVPDRHRHNKDANLFEKLLAACRWGATPWFLNVSDDNILLKPVHFGDCRAFYSSDLAAAAADFWGPGRWKDRLRHTVEELSARGLSTFHHDCHAPFPIHRDTFAAVCGRFDFRSAPGFTIHTLYGNAAPIAREPLGNRKVTYERPCHLSHAIARRLDDPEALFLGYNDDGLTPALEAEIEHRCPEPSPWEADARPVFPVANWRHHSPRPLAGEGPGVRASAEKMGTVPVPIFSDLTRRQALAALMAPYNPPPDPPPDPMPPATLLFHFAPWLLRPEMTAFHVRCLGRHLHQFSKVRINFVTGPDFADPEKLEAQLRAYARPDCDWKCFRNAHAPAEWGETRPFFRDLLPEVGEEENVCYAHSKGQMLSAQPGGRAWAEFMYESTMARGRLCCELLKTHPCAGVFLRITNHRGAQWMYAGTFFWFRGIRRFAAWPHFQHSRFGVEAWLGRFVPLEDAAITLPWAFLKHLTRNRGGLLDRYVAIPWGTT